MYLILLVKAYRIRSEAYIHISVNVYDVSRGKVKYRRIGIVGTGAYFRN